MTTRGADDGGATVTIPAAEYDDLVACKARLIVIEMVRARGLRSSRSPIDRDPDLALFLRERLVGGTIREVHEACLAGFGAARTPSRSAIDRFRHRYSEVVK